MTKNYQLFKKIVTKKKADKGIAPPTTKNQISGLSKDLISSLDKLQRTYQWLDTGYPELNALLKTDECSGGWPLGTTIETGLAEPGIGELRLFLPALRRLVKKNSARTNIILINPPFVPYAPALEKAQINPTYLTVVNTNNKADILWAAEQALSAKCCAAVLTWANAHSLSQKEARRLQLAAERSESLHVVFRHKKYLAQSSPFRLRLGLATQAHSLLDVTIVKQPLSWGGQQCVLSLAPHYEYWQRIHAAALPVSRRINQKISSHVKVLAKAKQVNKVIAISAKPFRLAKVS